MSARHSGERRNPVTENINLWTSALLVKSTAGRGSNGRLEAYGIKKLRALILELAMRGKLVPKTAGDKPAIQLLEAIEKEKARLSKEGVLKKEKPLPAVTDADKTCDLPSDWLWVRFGNIAHHNSGKTLDRGRNVGELRDYITTSNLYWGRFELSSVRKMPISKDELERCTARKGDLLICEGGESGRAAVWPHDYEVCFQNHVHRARFFGGIDPYFVYRFFEKLDATGEIDQYRKGVGISNMSSKALASIVMPLPPLAQQHRIVAKVDELMALCDQLEQQQGRGIEAHHALVETLLATLTNVESAEEFAAAWNRIAEHFDALFTTEHSIDQVKQTILQLAVMGKLVPQNPNDRPANLFPRKENRVVAKKVGNEVAVEKQTASRKGGLFLVPSGWAWVLIEDFCDVQGGIQKQPKRQPKKNHYPYLRVANVQRGYVDVGEMSRFELEAGELEKWALKKGDILVVEGNGSEEEIGRCAIWDGEIRDCVYQNHLIRVRTHLSGTEEFVTRFLNSPAGIGEMKRLAVTTSGLYNLSVGKIRAIAVPLPPLDEQHRIVAKVDELMALCDALKARLAEAQTTQIRLADAIVERAVAAPEAVVA
ncbi:MAG: restriction endonuclease subunit S [Burkholderiales bacterium]|nr:restriction endonuclease subunit S [Burkholderiales bacterium]